MLDHKLPEGRDICVACWHILGAEMSKKLCWLREAPEHKHKGHGEHHWDSNPGCLRYTESGFLTHPPARTAVCMLADQGQKNPASSRHSPDSSSLQTTPPCPCRAHCHKGWPPQAGCSHSPPGAGCWCGSSCTPRSVSALQPHTPLSTARQEMGALEGRPPAGSGTPF